MAQFEGAGFIEMRPSDVHDVSGSHDQSGQTTQATTLRSLTLLQFKKGQEEMQGNSSDAIWIDGHEASNVVVVGEIMSVQKHTAFTKYVVDDGTESLLVKQFKERRDGVGFEAEEEASVLEEGMWIKVHGHHRPFMEESFCNAFSIRPITDFNEITCHFAKCIQEHLHFTRGPLPRPGLQIGRPSVGNESTGRPSLVQPPDRGRSAQSGGGEMSEAIRKLLEDGGELHIDEICRRLEDDYGKRMIRQTVKEMADKGQLYMGSRDDAYMWSG